MISSCLTEVSNLEITVPWQLHKTNSKYSRKTEIIYHYRTESRKTETKRGGEFMFMECIMTLFTRDAMSVNQGPSLPEKSENIQMK